MPATDDPAGDCAEHLRVLRRGVEAWNKWRLEHPDVAPVLYGAPLGLRGLRGAQLDGADLSGANLGRTDLRDTDLRGSNLTRAHLGAANLTNAQLDRALLRGARLIGANLTNATARDADFTGARLREARLKSCNFDGSNLEGVRFFGASLDGASLQRTILRGADLTATVFRGVNLSGSDLTGALLASTFFGELPMFGTVFDGATIDATGWSPQGLDDLIARGARVIGVGALTQRLSLRPGLTLTFDTRLHRFDPTAFDALIAEVLGSSTDVTIEERSNLDSNGPAFIRINGSRIEDLVRVAEAFYERAWTMGSATVEEGAVERVLPAWVSVMIARLDEMRDHLAQMRTDRIPLKENADTIGSGALVVGDRHIMDRFEAVAAAVAAESRLRHDPPTVAAFIDRLEADVHAAVRELEGQRHQLQRWAEDANVPEREESLRSRLVSFLRGRGYDATAEADEGGATDILVSSSKFSLKWICECKIHRSYEALDEGMLQLHTRYASGRHPATGFIIFCFNEDAAAVCTHWKQRLVARRHCGLIEGPINDPQETLSFSTRHHHEGSGLDVVTRHIVASLYHRPRDRSARRSRARKASTE